ncbi:biotin-dependent carboxyltransferase family protein [Tuberibacillus sp. Marseille-P3662]|uniref:5-oxoprolinase subunit C family protein n=1 Tax=Tuberibacillus sp. Marseille-P3662 TaxID=1965358 RepID=UPI000A1CED60|nr:biotin-dependent carboxyltransferase family protein [Tuberibacillus sp. Marseille-P3662]
MININKPGLLTSIQDLGRHGLQKYGVIMSGVMDQMSHRIANLLVGNEENEATIEMTLLGPTLQFEMDSLIAICGGDLSPTIDGEPVRLWRSIFIKKGSELRLGRCQSGCRAYLAVAGGYKISSVMGSQSTYLRAEIGGLKGRALQTGDQIHFGKPSNLSTQIMDDLKTHLGNQRFIETDWSVTSELIPIDKTPHPIRVMKGRQYHLFTRESQENLFSESFEITPQSDRMGYRLKGSKLHLESKGDMISEAVSFGTIQVPAEGQPIVLLADRQTTGGYPKIGQVATVDLPYMAQLKPGDKVSFMEISLEAAQRLYLEQERKIQQLAQGITIKIR